MDVLRDNDRTPRARGCAPAPPVPSRPAPSLTAFRAGLPPAVDSPSLSSLARELFQLLDSGVASVSDTASGHAWPRPRIDGIRRLVEEFEPDLCLIAAKEAREIVQSQDRAPNITSLFEKKLRELSEVRETVREALS
jgi:hypothetical protein